MIKKTLCVFLTAILVFSLFTGVLASENDRVEIQFCVGDETLTINGESVTVEKPYVVGEGVTLVPLRVITEAFGAKVEWIEETQSIKLIYPDVDILLQIGNPIAEVNGKSEMLLAAPELPRESTMVPLRFISENFGAVVSYDEATEKITVVKEASGDSSLVEGKVENKYVGDSFYGWSMENPKNMTVAKRDFDGAYTLFQHDGNESEFDIAIYTMDEEYNFDKSFTNWKNDFKSFTLVKADKDTSKENKKIMHLQAKNKTNFYEVYEIQTDKYIFVMSGIFENADTEIKNECSAIMASFDTNYKKEDVYDFSNVVDGVRRFKAEAVKLSIDIPASYMLNSDDELENYFYFANATPEDYKSHISIGVYSIEQAGNARNLSGEDFERNKENCNPEVATFDKEVVTNFYKNLTTYEYAYTIKTSDENTYNRDIFFELGEYVYNIYFEVKLPNDEKESFVRNIMNSIEIEEINYEEMGTLIRNYNESDGGTYSVDLFNGCSAEMFNTYDVISESANAVAYTDGNVLFLCGMYNDRTYTYSDAKSVLRTVESKVDKSGGTIKSDIEEIEIADKKYVKMVAKSTENGKVSYCEMYITIHQSSIYYFEVYYTELGYSEAARQEAQAILESVVFE